MNPIAQLIIENRFTVPAYVSMLWLWAQHVPDEWAEVDEVLKEFYEPDPDIDVNEDGYAEWLLDNPEEDWFPEIENE